MTGFVKATLCVNMGPNHELGFAAILDVPYSDNTKIHM